jgi:dihydroorotate dehydrogenase
VKLSPDEEDAILVDLVGAALLAGAAGAILTNTTVSRDGLRSRAAREPGGLSGAPLRERATRALRVVRSAHPTALLIGVGGIFTGHDLLERLRAGANLVQIYTGFVYRGPKTVSLILGEFLDEMKRQGVSSVADLGSS